MFFLFPFFPPFFPPFFSFLFPPPLPLFSPPPCCKSPEHTAFRFSALSSWLRFSNRKNVATRNASLSRSFPALRVIQGCTGRWSVSGVRFGHPSEVWQRTWLVFSRPIKTLPRDKQHFTWFHSLFNKSLIATPRLDFHILQIGTMSSRQKKKKKKSSQRDAHIVWTSFSSVMNLNLIRFQEKQQFHNRAYLWQSS